MRAEPGVKQSRILESASVARMATVDTDGVPHIVPVCYVFTNGFIYTPIDKKPKTSSVNSLKRIKNIRSNPNVSFLIDEYYEDWGKLYFLKISGIADIIRSGDEYENALMSLSEKYPQYRRMDLLNLALPVIKITPRKIVSWGDITSGEKDG